MFFYMPMWLLTISMIYIAGFVITFILFIILTLGTPGDVGEFFPLSLFWPLVLPSLLIGIIFGIIEQIHKLLT